MLNPHSSPHFGIMRKMCSGILGGTFLIALKWALEQGLVSFFYKWPAS